MESLVLLSHDVLKCLSSQDEEKHRPKFVQLCHQLSLTEKVNKQTGGKVAFMFYVLHLIIAHTQEEVALRFIFINNVGVLFGKVRHMSEHLV